MGEGSPPILQPERGMPPTEVAMPIHFAAWADGTCMRLLIFLKQKKIIMKRFHDTTNKTVLNFVLFLCLQMQLGSLSPPS